MFTGFGVNLRMSGLSKVTMIEECRRCCLCLMNRHPSTVSAWPKICGSSPQEQIYLGGSSWKYEGWLGQIYNPQRYYSRGKFSQKMFEQRCLAEYGDTFPIVCGDFSFYQFPSEEFWTKLFDTASPRMQFAFKVPEEITCKTFPSHPRYGPRSGMVNPSFLSAEMFEEAFLQPLTKYRDRIAVLIFEFGTFSKKNYEQPRDFFADLDEFLASAAEGLALFRRDPKRRLPRRRILRCSAKARCCARVQLMESYAAAAQADPNRRSVHDELHSRARATAGRAVVRAGCRGVSTV